MGHRAPQPTFISNVLRNSLQNPVAWDGGHQCHLQGQGGGERHKAELTGAWVPTGRQQFPGHKGAFQVGEMILQTGQAGEDDWADRGCFRGKRLPSRAMHRPLHGPLLPSLQGLNQKNSFLAESLALRPLSCVDVWDPGTAESSDHRHAGKTPSQRTLPTLRVRL